MNVVIFNIVCVWNDSLGSGRHFVFLGLDEERGESKQLAVRLKLTRPGVKRHKFEVISLTTLRNSRF